MSKILSLTLKPKSGWVTPLQADTIFGHLCWKIKQEEGKDKLEGFLGEMAEKPFFVISNVFPQEYIPRPRLEEEFKKEKDGNKEEMAKEFDSIKDFQKNIKWIKIEELKNFSESAFNDAVRDKIMADVKKEKIPQSFSRDREIKTTISRFTSTTLEEQGPYSLPYYYLSEKKQGEGEKAGGKQQDKENALWLLMKVFDEDKISEYKIKKYLELVFKEGYGKRKSIGKGVFEIIKNDKGEEDWQNIKIPENQNQPKYLLLLSNFVPNKDDPTNGLYEIFVKYGKLGEEKSIAGSGNFYKKPLIMLKEGATFKIDSPNYNYKEYLGRMLKGKEISFDDEIYHYGYGFSLRF